MNRISLAANAPSRICTNNNSPIIRSTRLITTVELYDESPHRPLMDLDHFSFGGRSIDDTIIKKRNKNPLTGKISFTAQFGAVNLFELTKPVSAGRNNHKSVQLECVMRFFSRTNERKTLFFFVENGASILISTRSSVGPKGADSLAAWKFKNCSWERKEKNSKAKESSIVVVEMAFSLGSFLVWRVESPFGSSRQPHSAVLSLEFPAYSFQIPFSTNYYSATSSGFSFGNLKR